MVGFGLDADVMLGGGMAALRGEGQREQQEEGEEAHESRNSRLEGPRQ